jgi:hypothetical protein
MSHKPHITHVDFTSICVDELKHIEIEFEHKISRTGVMHGFGLYFDAYFRGSERKNQVILSTAPENPATHWYQTRLLMREPLGVTKNQKLKGTLKLEANTEQSFDGTLIVDVPALEIRLENHYDMKDLNYRGTHQSYVDYYASVNQQQY